MRTSRYAGPTHPKFSSGGELLAYFREYGSTRWRPVRFFRFPFLPPSHSVEATVMTSTSSSRRGHANPINPPREHRSATPHQQRLPQVRRNLEMRLHLARVSMDTTEERIHATAWTLEAHSRAAATNAERPPPRARPTSPADSTQWISVRHSPTGSARYFHQRRGVLIFRKAAYDVDSTERMVYELISQSSAN